MMMMMLGGNVRCGRDGRNAGSANKCESWLARLFICPETTSPFLNKFLPTRSHPRFMNKKISSKILLRLVYRPMNITFLLMVTKNPISEDILRVGLLSCK